MNKEKFKDFYAMFAKKPQLMMAIVSLVVLGLVLGLNFKQYPLVIVCVLIFVCMIVAYNIGKAESQSVKNNIRISSSNTISVDKRSTDNRRMFSIVKHSEQQFNYHPATATFTAATVGGVTTGGWSVDEAHYTATVGEKTDKCLLQFHPLDDRVGVEPILVKNILLSEEDVEIAKTKPYLREFISGNNNVIVLEHKIESKNASTASKYYKSTGDMYGSMNLLKEDYTKSLLTRKEIESIVDFLCGY